MDEQQRWQGEPKKKNEKKLCGAVKWWPFNAHFAAIVVAISKADLHYNLLHCLHTLCPRFSTQHHSHPGFSIFPSHFLPG